MYTILVDESTDVSVTKHLVMYVRVIDEHFRPHTVFFKNITIDHPKSDAQVLFDYIIFVSGDQR